VGWNAGAPLRTACLVQGLAWWGAEQGQGVP